MTSDEIQRYAQVTRRAWMIYAALAVLLALVLVFVVARDMEEQFFYGFMTIAGAYVFRPTERFMNRKIEQFTGLKKPEDAEAPKED